MDKQTKRKTERQKEIKNWLNFIVIQENPILGKGRDCDGSDKVVIETRVLGLKMEGEETN